MQANGLFSLHKTGVWRNYPLGPAQET